MFGRNQFRVWICATLFLISTGALQKARAQAFPVAYRHIVRENPNISLHMVTINLADPRVSVRVSRAGADPDGPGPWTTTLLPTSEIAAREQFDIAVNGDFFAAQNTQDSEGAHTGFVKGKWATPTGMAMTDGQVWHKGEGPQEYLEINASNRAVIVEMKPAAMLEPGARQIIGGHYLLVRDGKKLVNQSNFATTRHPRTGVGINKAGNQLTLMVVDGRQPALSIGMTLDEFGEEFVRLGCDRALNLDGGGSSTLVYREPKTGKLKIINSPSDTRERSVADVLGVSVKAPLPEIK